MENPFFGLIEAGGTKIVCGLGTAPEGILETVRFPTETPEVSIPKIAQYFTAAFGPERKPRGFGIAAFGPVDIRNPGSSDYGRVLDTPKKEWRGFSWRQGLSRVFPDIPVFIDTDVNCSALGESVYGAAKGIKNLVYFTVGTGIGAGIISSGEPLHGALHPEAGHIPISRSEEERRTFPGICPFHGDCLEGIASGPALAARWGEPAENLPENHPAWRLESDYLAQACRTLALIAVPERIILGGGVMEKSFLFGEINRLFTKEMAGYLKQAFRPDSGLDYIIPPGLGSQAGLYGALALAVKYSIK